VNFIKEVVWKDPDGEGEATTYQVDMAAIAAALHAMRGAIGRLQLTADHMALATFIRGASAIAEDLAKTK
jgi:predicted thioredoxin/glutaredoxin